jgi:hypothetical protein
MSLSAESVELLRLVFGTDWPEAWVSWKSNMRGKRVKDLVEGDLPGDEDCYFCIALFPEGVTERKLIFASKVHAMVIDDVGTKIDGEAFDMFAPAAAWKIETSPGNWQVGYVFEEPIKVREYENLRRRMKAHPVWGKSDGVDAVHLFRLPQGCNTKHDPAWRVS